ncbi:hypothetical protein [Streptomyces griseoruber]|uniref:hypothetical protein n=1 Tax=Streptomyces griseoruber TaxID=1943 RepID=UPI0037A704E2
MALNALVLPAALGYLGSRIAGGATSDAFWVTGAVVLGCANLAISQVATAMSADRFSGRGRLLICNGVSRPAYLWAHLIFAVMAAVLILGVATLTGVSLGLVRSDWWTLPSVVSAGVITGVALGSIGAIVAAQGKDRVGVTNATVLIGLLVPMASPLLYPVPTDQWAHLLSLISPATAVVELVRGTTGAAQPFPFAATAGGVIALVVFPLVASRCVRWS